MSDFPVLPLMLITIASSMYRICFPFSLFHHKRALGCLAAGNYRMRPGPWSFLASTHTAQQTLYLRECLFTKLAER